MKISFFILLVICFDVNAQITDSARQKDGVPPAVKKNFAYYFGRVPLKTVRHSTKFDLQIDTRNSFVQDFPINVYGVNAGIILRERFRLGVGYYWFNENFNDKLLGIYSDKFPQLAGKIIITPKGVPVPVSLLRDRGYTEGSDYYTAAQNIDLWFTSVGFMYTFYASRLVEFAIPIEIGYGKFTEKLYDISGNNFGSVSVKPEPTAGNFIPGQIGFDLLLKVHRWFYLEGSYGYRKTLGQNYTSKSRATSFDSQFDGEYYNYGVKIQLGTIIKEWKAKKKKGTGEQLPVK